MDTSERSSSRHSRRWQQQATCSSSHTAWVGGGAVAAETPSDMMTMEWNGMESHGGLKVTIRQTEWKKKLPNNFVAQTSECSWRATVAPAGWTSSGLRAPKVDGPGGRWHPQKRRRGSIHCHMMTMVVANPSFHPSPRHCPFFFLLFF